VIVLSSYPHHRDLHSFPTRRSSDLNSQVFEYPVITDSDLSEIQDFEEIIVKTNPADGSIVLLKDVARVELGQFNYATTTRVDGMTSTGMMVAQTPGGNAVETAEGIYTALEELKQSFPP